MNLLEEDQELARCFKDSIDGAIRLFFKNREKGGLLHRIVDYNIERED